MEQHYALYRQSLRILMCESASINQIKRSFCWQRLMRLHLVEPRHFPDPHHLYWQFKRDFSR